jgi:uncharacterized protein (TIGR00288 family)
VTADEERIALFLDYENLAIGAREALGRGDFDFRPIADALATRGRVVVRKAYADWTFFEEDRRALTRHQVELIEIPQRMGAVRKNAADIKMAVDAIELCFERDYITTFVLGTGDSDFTPLVHKLRELNRRVIGVGIEASTSALLPPACDEFLFYERLEGVEGAEPGTRRRSRRGGTRRSAATASIPAEDAEPDDTAPAAHREADLGTLVTQTLAGLESTGSGPVLASMLKRTMLRRDPTFNEADYGFRSFGELLRNLAQNGTVALADGGAKGDPEVGFPEEAGGEAAAFELLRATVERLSAAKSGPPHLSGLKTQLRRTQPDFSEKKFGFGGFLQFAKAARARGLVDMEFDEQAEDYVLRPAGTPAPPA